MEKNFNNNFVSYDAVEDSINDIVFELKNNKAAIIPTDTLAGIISYDKKLIYKIKKRPSHKKLILFVPSFESIGTNNPIFKKLAKQFWPGPLTIVENGISYRMPNDPFLLKLLNKTGMIYSSSANLSGKNPIKNENEAFSYFNKYKNDIIFIYGNYLIESKPSTVFDINKNKLLREGEIQDEKIKEWTSK